MFEGIKALWGKMPWVNTPAAPARVAPTTTITSDPISSLEVVTPVAMVPTVTTTIVNGVPVTVTNVPFVRSAR